MRSKTVILLLQILQMATSLSITDLACQSLIETWLWNVSNQTTLNRTEATLSVSWKELDEKLESSSCQYDTMFLELWRSDHDNKVKVWNKMVSYEFRGCDSMNNFILHDKDDRKQRDAKKPDKAVFSHVLEDEYLFRLCPCGNQVVVPRDIRNSQRICNCEYKESRNFCSDLIHLPGVGEEKVSNLCTGRGNHEHGNAVHEIQPPVVECRSAQLSGTLLTCTPAQNYDKLMVELYPVEDEVDSCHVNHHSDNSLVIKKVADLNRVNQTHGKFAVDTDGLDIGQSYCVRLQVQNQPYCSRNSIDTVNGNKQPKICSTLIRNPLRTTNQCQSASSLSVFKTLPLWLGLSLGISLLMLALLVFCTIKHKNNLKPKFKEIAKSNSASMKEIQVGNNIFKDSGQILLVSFLESEDFADLNQEFKRFLSSCGSNVVDFSENNEELMCSQETWTEDLIQRPCTRIVVVDSPMASEAAMQFFPSPAAADGLEVEAEGQKQPLLLLDPLSDLRRNCIRLVHSQFRGNYKKLCVVSIRGCQSRKSVIQDLVPSTKWVLPENLKDVKDWVCQSYTPASGTIQSKEQDNKFLDKINTFVSKNLANHV